MAKQGETGKNMGKEGKTLENIRKNRGKQRKKEKKILKNVFWLFFSYMLVYERL